MRMIDDGSDIRENKVIELTNVVLNKKVLNLRRNSRDHESTMHLKKEIKAISVQSVSIGMRCTHS